MFYISEDELDRLALGYSSIDQLMLGMTGGGLISVAIVFLTVPLAGNPLSIFVGLLAVSAIGTLTFGMRVVAGKRASKADAERLKSQHSPA